MRSVHRKIVYWSDKDHCYVGLCPSLFFGGVHGPNETKVWRELSQVVREELESTQRVRKRQATATRGNRSRGGKVASR